MQKMIIIVLIVGLGLFLVNLIWTANISSNLSKALDIIKKSPRLETDFIKTVEQIKDSKALERISFSARGSIKEIKGRTLILEYKGSVLEIPVDANAQIVKQISKEIVPEIISFEDLQVGNELIVSVEIKKDGSLKAYRISKY
ncbi:MAG: hypothetical protein HYT19_00100 [Candidatus Nealsonbacteria bacterium]|nr:hypothetical protein [Candidatus Nealsonbacteria bacterium]